MSKNYTELQYKQYLKHMEKIGVDDIEKGFLAHLDYRDWIKENRISEKAINEMDARLEKDFIEGRN